jgi:hypothetical protein
MYQTELTSMLSRKQKIHRVEMEQLIKRQQREINVIIMGGGLQINMEEPVHEVMVTCVARIGSFLMNKDWRMLMISSKRLLSASKVLQPVWTGCGRINMGLNFSDVVGFDPHPLDHNNSNRPIFALRDHNNIYIIDGQSCKTIKHQRVELNSVRNPMGSGNTICISSKYIVTGGADECIRMWHNHSPYHSQYTIGKIGLIHDVAITLDSTFLAVRTSDIVTVRKTDPREFGDVTNRYIFSPTHLHGPMVFSEMNAEIVLIGSSHDKDPVKTISLIFWKYKFNSMVDEGGADHIRQVDYPRYPCSDKSKHSVSSIYVSKSGTTMAIQYRSPDEIVVMKRNVENMDELWLEQVAKFDIYSNTFDRRILFGSSSYNDVIVFATDVEVYVASIKCNCTTLPAVYKNRNNSFPLCILPDEKAMVISHKNDRDDNIADKHPTLIMPIPKAYQDFTKKCREGELEI